jgi:gas vesicle protein
VISGEPKGPSKRKNIMDKLGSFLLGLGIGVGVGLLFAPQSGEETRDLLKSKADEGKDYLRRQSEDLRGSAADIVDKGREVINRQRDSLSEALEAGKQAYREKIDQTQGQPS